MPIKDREKRLDAKRHYHQEHKQIANRKRKELYWATRNKNLEDNREYYRIHKNEISQRKKKKYESITAKGKYDRYRRAAKYKGITFTISFEDFYGFWQEPCFYCGDPISTVGIDRVDNTLGYEVGNLLPCCPICNHMRTNKTFDEYVDQCMKVTNNLK